MWMRDVAAAHIEKLSLGLAQYLELKHAMVAVSIMFNIGKQHLKVKKSSYGHG